jgi:hypothetical protein
MNGLFGVAVLSVGLAGAAAQIVSERAGAAVSGGDDCPTPINYTVKTWCRTGTLLGQCRFPTASIVGTTARRIPVRTSVA